LSAKSAPINIGRPTRNMRYFNSSGPNIPEEHYTLDRPGLIAKGLELVARRRYFTIWAPRQTGKSTYFLMLKKTLEKTGYKVVKINVEDSSGSSFATFRESLRIEFAAAGLQLPMLNSMGDLSNYIRALAVDKLVLIVDEIEGLNPDLFGSFLHTIRNLYHSREEHGLKSVILVGVSNIVGVVSDNASPFNVADNLNVPYFTDAETAELLNQHERETGQLFDKKVVRKISQITANQPGLVNGFAFQLVERNPNKKKIVYKDYLAVEHWYLNVAIDKNFANILNKARQYRSLLESLLFSEAEIPFKIDREAIKVLHTNGIIRENKAGMVEFWVPFYKKRLFDSFYPYTNGERGEIGSHLHAALFFKPDGMLDIPKLMDAYKEYAARRGFGVFREKDAQGNFTSIKEAGLIYSFETFLAAFLTQAGGKSYREADAGLGKSDLIVNVRGREILFETKKYYGFAEFERGKKQISYYARSLGLKTAVYVVFIPNDIRYPEAVHESVETVKKVETSVYLIPYDEKKDF
jgi:AAA-like domain